MALKSTVNITFCPSCKSELKKLDHSEFYCKECNHVFDLVAYTKESWDEINMIMVDE